MLNFGSSFLPNDGTLPLPLFSALTVVLSSDFLGSSAFFLPSSAFFFGSSVFLTSSFFSAFLGSSFFFGSSFLDSVFLAASFAFLVASFSACCWRRASSFALS